MNPNITRSPGVYRSLEKKIVVYTTVDGPDNPPQCQNTCFSSSCPPMVTQGHFFHLQHHLLYPFATRLWQYTMTNLQKGKANTVPLERNKGLQHQDEHNPFVVGLNELLGHIALNRKTEDLLHTLGN
jgi:hypothetical protein